MTNKQKSVFFMILSVLGFSLMSVVIKYIPEIDIYEKIFFRNSVSFLISVYLITNKKLSLAIGKKNFSLVFLRSFFGFIGIYLNFYAITYLTIADSNILNRLSPIFIAIFAYIILKEKLDKIQILCIIFMILGTILVIKPSFSVTFIPSLAGVLSAAFGGLSYTIIRYLNNKVHPDIIVFIFSLFSCVFSIPLMYSNFTLPNKIQFLFLLGIGLTASIGQFGLTYAYKYAKASEVSIYNYTGILFGIILGFIFLNEIPDVYSVIGGSIIIITAISLYRHNKKIV